MMEAGEERENTCMKGSFVTADTGDTQFKPEFLDVQKNRWTASGVIFEPDGCMGWMRTEHGDQTTSHMFEPVC
jgi:hypothetical protein